MVFTKQKEWINLKISKLFDQFLRYSCHHGRSYTLDSVTHHIVEVDRIHLMVLHHWTGTHATMVDHIHLIVLYHHVVEVDCVHLMVLHRQTGTRVAMVDHIHLIVLHHHVVEVNCIHLIVLHRWIDTCVAMVNHIHLIVLPHHVVEDNRIHLKVLHQEIVSNAKMKYWISFYYCQSKTSYLGHSSLKPLPRKTSWKKSLSKGKRVHCLCWWIWKTSSWK